MTAQPDRPCPTCRYMTKDGRCRTKRCPEFAPCDPAVRDAAIRSMRAALANRKVYK